jgi:hypothetical protein
VIPYQSGNIYLVVKVAIALGSVRLEFIVLFHGITAFPVSIISEKAYIYNILRLC